MPPLRYQWYKDGRKMLAATADTAKYILASVTAQDSGSYHCQVSNKDGTVTSTAAVLTVKVAARAQRTGAASGVEVRNFSLIVLLPWQPS